MLHWKGFESPLAILGAGFSYACTNGRLPLMAGFFDELSLGEYPDLYIFVHTAFSGHSESNIENVYILLDQIQNSPSEIFHQFPEHFRPNPEQIRAQLHQYAFNRLMMHEHLVPTVARDVLREVPTGATFISMNYDTIVDHLLSVREGIRHQRQVTADNPTVTCPHCKMVAILSKSRDENGLFHLKEEDWRGSLLKLHGSLAWRQCTTLGCSQRFKFIAEPECRPNVVARCDSCDCIPEPAMVFPTMSKRLNEIPEIVLMWKAAILAIQNADAILLYGFSLPESDALFGLILKNSIASSRKLKRVSCIDTHPDKVLERFRRCIPRDLSVEEVTLEVGNNRTPSWYVPMEIDGSQVRLDPKLINAGVKIGKIHS